MYRSRGTVLGTTAKCSDAMLRPPRPSNRCAMSLHMKSATLLLPSVASIFA